MEKVEDSPTSLSQNIPEQNNLGEGSTLVAATSGKHEFIRENLPKIGGYLSVIYLLFLAVMAAVAWQTLWAMQPNEFGDLMAGVFAPLAFLWLVLGFFQQGEELKASVSALELQGRELNASAEQQRELVKVTREKMEKDLEVLADERAAAEHAAQPLLVTRTLNRPNEEEVAEISIHNLGAWVTDSTLWIDGIPVSGLKTMEKGDAVKFRLELDKLTNLESLDFIITYIDALGKKRGKAGSCPVKKLSGTTLELSDGIMEPRLLKDPFKRIKEVRKSCPS